MHKVLVVDDDAEIGRLVASYLRQHGFGVRVAGAEAGMRQMLAAEPPDLLVLDLMLPGKDGLTIIKELRSDPLTALLPVLMLSARAEDIDRVVGLELGADDYLTKPFLPRELLARVRAVLRRVTSDPAASGAGPNRYLLFGDWIWIPWSGGYWRPRVLSRRSIRQSTRCCANCSITRTGPSVEMNSFTNSPGAMPKISSGRLT